MRETIDKQTTQNGPARREDEIARKLQAAEAARSHRRADAPDLSPVRSAATARKLKRAQGLPEVSAPPVPVPVNERKALEKTERENRLKAGGSGFRETLIRIGLGDVDTATLLIVGFSFLAMFVLPMLVIISS